MSLKDIFKRNKPLDGAGLEGIPSTSEPKEAKINASRITEAYHLLNEYKRGKANLEQKIKDNEEWYRVRHWQHLKGGGGDVEPSSAWLFNSLANKHASAMDNFPSPVVLPREERDRGEAEALSHVLPVALDHCDFEETYDSAYFAKLKTGAACYGVFWDQSMHNGLGDINVRHIDGLNLFWEPGITDIQKSANIFHVELCSNDVLEERYPSLHGKLGSKGLQVTEYNYDDQVNTSDKSAVVDWYYKKRVGSKDVLHYCKFVGETVLFATENEPENYPDGWYIDGMYPFVIDVLYHIPGSIWGFGYIDIGKNPQKYIDQMGKVILENGFANATVKHFVPTAGDVNEEEFLDRTKPLVHYSGSGDGIVPVRTSPLSGIYYDIYQGKIDELKETTGNRDVNTGGSASGVTAASAIAALQEAGSRLDRADIRSTYRAFRKVILMCIERIRQFYDLPRWFRIVGADGSPEFIQYANENLAMRPVRFENGQPTEYRMPYFDVEISAEKQSPYSRLSQNELALQFYNLGFFNPQMADQALACLEMMDFDRKSFVTKKISENGTLYDQLMMMQQQMIGMQATIDRLSGTSLAPEMAASMGGAAPAPVGGEAPKLSAEAKESPVTQKARQRVAEATTPV